MVVIDVDGISVINSMVTVVVDLFGVVFVLTLAKVVFFVEVVSTTSSSSVVVTLGALTVVVVLVVVSGDFRAAGVVRIVLGPENFVLLLPVPEWIC